MLQDKILAEDLFQGDLGYQEIRSTIVRFMFDSMFDLTLNLVSDKIIISQRSFS